VLHYRNRPAVEVGRPACCSMAVRGLSDLLHGDSPEPSHQWALRAGNAPSALTRARPPGEAIARWRCVRGLHCGALPYALLRRGAGDRAAGWRVVADWQGALPQL